MSFIKQALEECSGCGNSSKTNQAVSWKNGADPKVAEGTATTYDDGEGTKDTVIISGPLSHAYTQALLLTLKKEPLQEKTDAPSAAAVIEEVVSTEDPLLKNDKNTIGIATESTQQDEDIERYIFSHFQDNPEEVRYLANKFDFIHPDRLPVNVVCKTTLIGMTDFMKIESFMEFTKDRSNRSIEYAVVVLPDSLNRTSRNTVQRKFVNVDTFDPSFEDQLKEFTAAIEAHVKPAGYKVFMGMEEYFKYLHDFNVEKRN